MTLLDSVLVVAVLGAIAWLVVSQRRRLRREVDSKLRSAVLHTEEGETVFDGAQAVVLLKDYEHRGGDEGPALSAKYLCKMPGGAAYWVIVDSAFGESPAQAEICELIQAEVDDVLTTYPYLKHLHAHLQRGAHAPVAAAHVEP